MNQKILQYLRFSLENGLLTKTNFNMRKTRLKQNKYNLSCVEAMVLNQFLTDEIPLEKAIANIVKMREQYRNSDKITKH